MCNTNPCKWKADRSWCHACDAIVLVEPIINGMSSHMPSCSLSATDPVVSRSHETADWNHVRKRLLKFILQRKNSKAIFSETAIQPSLRHHASIPSRRTWHVRFQTETSTYPTMKLDKCNMRVIDVQRLSLLTFKFYPLMFLNYIK